MALTQLSVVNDMLASVGSQPLANLGPPLSPEATLAVNLLERVRVEVLSEGWHFNTEREVEWTPVDGKIAPDADALSFKENETKSWKFDLTVREGSLFDLFEKTDVFAGPVYVDVIRDIPFDQLIEAAKSYIAAKATHIFQARIQGDRVIFAVTQEDVLVARRALMSKDCRDSGANFLTSNKSTAQLALRESPLDTMEP